MTGWSNKMTGTSHVTGQTMHHCHLKDLWSQNKLFVPMPEKYKPLCVFAFVLWLLINYLYLQNMLMCGVTVKVNTFDIFSL